MIIKCLLLHIFLFIVPTICMSQAVVSRYVEDVDGHPINRLLDDGKTVEYMTLEGRKVIATLHMVWNSMQERIHWITM